ncbi:hypothetical protein JCM19046_2852 [Bacillus sp. JCM 19046]|nr:hypothetical protein JCM19045_1650 [Bacillus sp. JCM 19045]GAF18287.1 hypothetical protein JCM19046_2852 [Bacillus sp. JCM 19046]
MKRISIMFIIFTLLVNISLPYISTAASVPSNQERFQEEFDWEELSLEDESELNVDALISA